jgi:transketolase
MNKIEFTSAQISQWARLGPRATYGQVLLTLAAQNSQILALSADLGNSSGLDRMKSSTPKQFVNTGIAEQNMIGVAAGLAKEGFTVFASSFAPFIAFRAGEQIRMNMGYMCHNIKAVGIGSGLSMGFLGNSHYGTEDVAVIRSIPNVTIVSPADTTEVAKVVVEASNILGPFYIRLTGAPGNQLVNHSDYKFEIGKAIKLKNGTDVSLIATGSMVAEALNAASILGASGISASVINMHTIKPIDIEILEEVISANIPIYTLEEHSVIGGLGSAVAEYISNRELVRTLKRIGIPDSYGVTGSYNFLLEEYGLKGPLIANLIMSDFDSSTAPRL